MVSNDETDRVAQSEVRSAMSLTRRTFLTVVCALALCGAASAQMGASLVPPSSATCIATQSGSWQAAATWDGRIPQAGDRVYIPAGITVELHGVTADVLWLHVAGVLSTCHCENPQDARLNVHTLFVPMSGAIRFGMPDRPYRAGCIVEFTPGPFLPGDTTQLSRGLICHGEFMASGVEKTAWGPVTAELPVGATSLKTPAVSGWKAGDRLIVAGTDSILYEGNNEGWPHRYQSEFVTVTGLLQASDGVTVQFSPPLKYRHFRWRADKPFHVANLTRNVVFRSRDPNARGHLMFMSSMCDMRHVAVEGCGRTDAMRPVTDPRFDVYGELIPGSDANVRARYSVHWHRIGQLSKPAVAIGCVVDGSPKWGFLIHDSNAHLKDCIAVNCMGSGFATEEGQERGSITRCLSAMNRGMGDVVPSSDEDFSRPAIGDFGISGDGFWLQGGLVEVSDSVAFDNSGRGFGLFNGPLNGYPRYRVPAYLQFPIEVDGTLLPIDYGGVAKAPAGAVPQRVFARNTAYGNKVGVQCWSSRPDDGSDRIVWPPTVRGSITDLTLFGRGCMLHMEYGRQWVVDGVTIVASGGFRRFGHVILPHAPLAMRGHHVTVKRLSIEGFTTDSGYPNPVPIVSVGDNGIDPDHVIESDYPVQAFGYTRN